MTPAFRTATRTAGRRPGSAPAGGPLPVTRRAPLLELDFSARGGDLPCGRTGDRVALAGPAVLYLRGEICV